MNKYYAYKNAFQDKLGARVHKFVSEYIKIVQHGHGNITLHCKPLWEMTNKEFEEVFGVEIKEKVIGLNDKEMYVFDESL